MFCFLPPCQTFTFTPDSPEGHIRHLCCLFGATSPPVAAPPSPAAAAAAPPTTKECLQKVFPINKKVSPLNPTHLTARCVLSSLVLAKAAPQPRTGQACGRCPPCTSRRWEARLERWAKRRSHSGQGKGRSPDKKMNEFAR